MTSLVYHPPADEGLKILYQDDSCLILDKPSGLLTVPGRGAEKADCLAARVQRRVPQALTVHRLDMGTSGLVLMALNPQAHRAFNRLFEQRHMEKHYVALVAGRVAADEGVVDLPLLTDWPNRPRQKVDLIDGKPSITRFRVLARDSAGRWSRLSLSPLTGRSHQLRVHLQSLGHPIFGDELYADANTRDAAPRLLLHAERLAFIHPLTGQPVAVSSPAPFGDGPEA